MEPSNLIERAQSLRRAVEYGKTNGKRNLIVDLDLLDEIFRGNVPVGGNEKPPEDVNAMMYELKAERDRLQWAADKTRAELERCRAALTEIAAIPRPPACGWLRATEAPAIAAAALRPAGEQAKGGGS